MVGPRARIRVLSEASDPVASRLGRLLDVPVLSGLKLVWSRPDLVFVRANPEGLRRAAWMTTLAGAGAVIAVPVGTPSTLPWWGRRFHRFLLRSQPEAQAWADAGVSLGRLVVVEPGEDAAERAAIAAIMEEALSMARRPDARRAAR